MTLKKLLERIVMPRLIDHMSTLGVRAAVVAVYISISHAPMQTLAYHATQLGWAKTTVSRVTSILIDMGWAYVSMEKGPYKSRLLIPTMPAKVESEVAEALMNVRNDVAYIGEWLMRCWLDLIVADHDAWDNARPPWLVTGTGSGRLELDRWYRSARVAFEFQGPQHFKTGSDLGADPDEIANQILRDNAKAGICHRHQITLIELTGLDLNPHIIQGKIDDFLPMIPLKESGPIYSTLMKMCQSYMNTINRHRKQESKLSRE